MKAMVTLLAAFGTLMIQGAAMGAHAANAAGECQDMSVTKYLMSDFHDSTSSTTWVNIHDGQLTFTMPTAGCAIITFSAQVNNYARNNDNPSDALHVRTLVDVNGGHGSLCAPALQPDIFFQNVDVNTYAPLAMANTITRICRDLSAGAHTVQVQFRQDAGGPGVDMLGHVLTVTHP